MLPYTLTGITYLILHVVSGDHAFFSTLIIDGTFPESYFVDL